MTIHSIEISGPKSTIISFSLTRCINSLPDPTVIPGAVKSQISLRIVPDQDLETISKSLVDFLEDGFQQIQSPNELKVTLCALHSIV